jgi:Protein of unknown function (DUF5663)
MLQLEELIEDLVSTDIAREQRAGLLQVLYEELEIRVGTRLAEAMNTRQLAAFEVFITNKDEQGALRWLQTNFPDYREVVKDEFERLGAELHTCSDDLDAFFAIYLGVDVRPSPKPSPWQR